MKEDLAVIIGAIVVTAHESYKNPSYGLLEMFYMFLGCFFLGSILIKMAPPTAQKSKEEEQV